MYIHKTSYITGLFIMLCLVSLSGCKYTLSQKANADLSRRAVSDPNLITNFNLTILPDGSKSFNYHANFISEEPVVTIPFWEQQYSLLEIPVVKGSINGKTYPVAFDTGNASNCTIIEDIHVRQNDLPVYFFEPDSEHSPAMALVREFRVGSLCGTDYPCMVFDHHTQVKLMGIGIGRSRHVIIPLILMEKFKYFEFDQVQNKVTFTAADSFQPDDPSQWIQLPFEIRDNRILLTLEIEGIKTTLFLDTGGGAQIELQQEFVEQIYEKRPEWKDLPAKDITLFRPFLNGNLQVKSFDVPTLRLGNHIVDDVQIACDTTSYQKMPYQGMIGFILFKNTVMCLDFENHILWIKKDGRFGQSK